ncbi:hypothetical protein [Mycolicibacterium sphagni]|nr:hypothetical protein [Mycolicibacterium sphagni]
MMTIAPPRRTQATTTVTGTVCPAPLAAPGMGTATPVDAADHEDNS